MTTFNVGDFVCVTIDVDTCYAWGEEESEAKPLLPKFSTGIITYVDEHTSEDLLDNDGMLQADIRPHLEPAIRVPMLLQHMRPIPQPQQVVTGWETAWDDVPGESSYLISLFAEQGDETWILLVEREVFGEVRELGSINSGLSTEASNAEVHQFFIRAWAHFWRGLESERAS